MSIIILCPAGKRNRWLSISFSKVDLTTDSLYHRVADLISRNYEIATLDLTNTNLTDEACALIDAALEKNSKLKHIILKANPQLSPHMIAAINTKLSQNRSRHAPQSSVQTRLPTDAQEHKKLMPQPKISDEVKTAAQLPAQVEMTSLDQTKKFTDKTQHLKANAFKRIYRILRAGESGFFKTNFLSDKEGISSAALIASVSAYAKRNKDSRTAKAWALAQVHFDRCNINNKELFTEAYKWAFDKSGIFKKSCVTGATFFKSASLNTALDRALLSDEQIARGRAKINSRTFKISRAFEE